MELKALGKKLSAMAGKYRYVILILVIGLAFMLIPSAQTDEKDKPTEPSAVQKQEFTLQQQLTEVLMHLNGAGNVTVLLTTKEGEETIYQMDTDTSRTQDDLSQNSVTVTVSDSQREEMGLIRQVNPEKYLGAVIVCEGADDPTVRLAVTDAVSKATGLGANSISVLKMK